MKVLVLWGDPHSPNLGVQALGQGTAALVAQTWPDADIRYQGYGPGDAPTRPGNPRQLAKDVARHPADIVRWLRSFDLAVDTRGGDSFADIYGVQRLAVMTTTAAMLRLARVPLVMGPQTVGPFTTRRGRGLARVTLRTASAVLVRDTASAGVAHRLGRSDVAVSTDVVFALPVPPAADRSGVLLNVSGLLWNANPHCDHLAYRRVVTQLWHCLRAEGRDVALLAHVLDSPLADNDVPACRELAADLSADGGVPVLVPRSLTEVRQMVAGAELVIGSRMHACLNALSVGTPAVPLAYSRKFEPLLDDLNWPHTVDLRTGTDQVERVLAAAQAVGSTAAVAPVLERAAARLTTARDVLAVAP